MQHSAKLVRRRFVVGRERPRVGAEGRMLREEDNCLVTAAFVAAMILLAPSVAMAQDEDTMMPERNVVEAKSVE